MKSEHSKLWLYQKAQEYTEVLTRLQGLIGNQNCNVVKRVRITLEFDNGLKKLDLTDYTTDMHKLEIVQQIAGTIAGDLRDIEKQIKQQIDGI